MKKFLYIIICSVALSSYAQLFEVRQASDDALITDNQILNFTESGCGINEDCKWNFKVINTHTSDIYMRIFIDSMTGSDGSNVQFCFSGTCLFSVNVGTVVPTTPALIANGGALNFGNYFWNQNPVNTPTPMSWTMRFQAYDAADNEIGTPLFVTYDYNNASLSTQEYDSDLSTLHVFPSIADTTLTVRTNVDLSVEFFDILGKRVKNTTVTKLNNTIDVSDLSSQMYMVRFTDINGVSTIRKIVVN